MKQPKRLEAKTESVDRGERLDLLDRETRDERGIDVVEGPEDVLEGPFDRHDGRLIREDLDRGSLDRVVAPDVVEPERVVDVVVREEDRIAPIQPEPQGMLPVIGGTIEQDHPGITLGIPESDRSAASGPPIAKILA